ncbi:MAG: hypothetical protein ACO4AU_13715 [bacterium]
MAQAPALYAGISGHGLGHLSQVAPILNAWRRRHPESRLVVQTALGRARSISRENFFQGRIEPVLSELRALPPVPQVDPTGAQEALEWLEQVGG